MKQYEYLDKEVFCKKTGLIGKVVSENDVMVIVELQGIRKATTKLSFDSRYTLVPEDNQDGTPKTSKTRPFILLDKRPIKGEKGIGAELRTKFLAILKEYGDIVFYTKRNAKKKLDTIKCNGFVTFELYETSRRLTIFCHPNSLSPKTKSLVNDIVPKSWGWSLRAKYIVCETSHIALMRMIIADGVYYRTKKD